jgi:hypothetical protein
LKKIVPCLWYLTIAGCFPPTQKVPAEQNAAHWRQIMESGDLKITLENKWRDRNVIDKAFPVFSGEGN